MLGTCTFCKKTLILKLKRIARTKWLSQYSSFRQRKSEKERKNCYGGWFSLTIKCYLIQARKVVEPQYNNKLLWCSFGHTKHRSKVYNWNRRKVQTRSVDVQTSTLLRNSYSKVLIRRKDNYANRHIQWI